MVILHQTYRAALGLCLSVLAVGPHASADVILDVNGTPANATITASVTNGDAFQPGGGGVLLQFFLPPNSSDVDVEVEGTLSTGPSSNPWLVRGPADGSYLNLIQISPGDFSTFVLDQNNPITSSANVTQGSITDLAVFDGTTSFMSINTGSGPATNVTLNYNVVPEPASLALLGVSGLVLLARRRDTKH